MSEKDTRKRGTRYSIGNQEIFQSEMSSRYPEGLESGVIFGPGSSRHLGVKSLKNAKLSRRRYPTVQAFIKIVGDKVNKVLSVKTNGGVINGR
ncbi:MAG: hypothetical protein HOF02_03990 [Gammaproteobacteria bacterium]|jgi:hypothetical protein|nr:hypothetical protein [Gammaproteobacteria bacterium]MBT6874414.1 hypothetical protein [Euryarchaeota archaeon]